MTTSLVLWARHGQNEANLTRQFSYRRLDLDLTERGWEQAAQLAFRLADRLAGTAGSPVVVSSPLRRARQTADVVAARLGVDVSVLDSLREVNVGDLDGRNDPAAWAMYESVLAGWRIGDRDRRFPGGENWHELCARLRTALSGVAVSARGGTAVVVAHGANLRAALSGLADVPEPAGDLDTGALAELRVTSTGSDMHVDLLTWGADVRPG